MKKGFMTGILVVGVMVLVKCAFGTVEELGHQEESWIQEEENIEEISLTEETEND